MFLSSSSFLLRSSVKLCFTLSTFFMGLATSASFQILPSSQWSSYSRPCDSRTYHPQFPSEESCGRSDVSASGFCCFSISDLSSGIRTSCLWTISKSSCCCVWSFSSCSHFEDCFLTSLTPQSPRSSAPLGCGTTGRIISASWRQGPRNPWSPGAPGHQPRPGGSWSRQ